MRSDEVNKVKQALETGKPILMASLYSYSPTIVETFGYAGVELLFLDAEHSPTNWETLENLCRACEVSGIIPQIRVDKQYPGYPSNIRKAMEIGAGVVLVPHINNKKEAVSVVRAAKLGHQYKYGEEPADQLSGWGGISRSKRYNVIGAADWVKQRDSNVLVAIQIEEKRALDNIDEISSVEGLDMITMGPADYANNLGLPGQSKHPDVVAAAKIISEVQKKRKQVRGTGIDFVQAIKDPKGTKEKVKEAIREGYHTFNIKHDLTILRIVTQTCKKILDEAYEEVQSEKK